MKLRLLPFVFLLSVSCNADTSDYSTFDPQAGGKGPIKQFHVKGRHQCQSHDFIGYMCEVELRDASDCQNGHMRNKQTNCCKLEINGKKQLDGMSINYLPGACSPIF